MILRVQIQCFKEAQETFEETRNALVQEMDEFSLHINGLPRECLCTVQNLENLNDLIDRFFVLQNGNAEDFSK